MSFNAHIMSMLQSDQQQTSTTSPSSRYRQLVMWWLRLYSGYDDSMCLYLLALELLELAVKCLKALLGGLV